MTRLILVGENPARDDLTGRPALSLTGSSGRNLCRVARWPWSVYLARTLRLNLFYTPQPRWSAAEARERAAAISRSLTRESRVILLGSKVASAFGVLEWPNYEWKSTPRGRIARVPHPSGMNRMWNDAAERERAFVFLRDLLK